MPADDRTGAKPLPRVTLTDGTLEDEWLTVALETDPRVMAELGGPWSADEARATHRRRIAGIPANGFWWFTVRRVGADGAGEPVGTIGVWDSEWEGESISETGWMTLPEHQGKGYATAALAAILERERAEHRWGDIHAFPPRTRPRTPLSEVRLRARRGRRRQLRRPPPAGQPLGLAGTESRLNPRRRHGRAVARRRLGREPRTHEGGLTSERWPRVVHGCEPVAAGLAAWVTLGVLLVTRANNLGLIDDISISPTTSWGMRRSWSLAFTSRGRSSALRGARWREAFPPFYGGLGLGFLLTAAWVVLDPIWRDTLGIRSGIENGSPHRAC